LLGSGWTTAYLSVVALGVLAIALTLALVKNTPNGKASDPQTSSVGEVWASVKTVWLRPGTRLGFFTHMGTQFSVTVFALIWGQKARRQMQTERNLLEGFEPHPEETPAAR
jgi:hypothetical protein